MKIICQLIYKVLCLAMLVCMTAMPAKAGERHEEPSLSTGCPEDTNTMVRTTDTVKVQLPSDSIFARYLRQQGYVITPHNQLTLLTSGRSKFESLFHEIRNARHQVHLEYFNFRSDSIAKELFTLLAEKAKEGVKVRALFDAFGNFSNNRPLRKDHLRAYHFLLRFWTLW